MKLTRTGTLWLIAGAVAWLAEGVTRAQAPAPLVLVMTVPLPDVHGRFDHFAIDAKGQRLYVAALGNDSLEVVDVAAGKRVQSVTGMSKPTGVLFWPGAGKVVVANGGRGTLTILNGTSLKVEQVITGFADADNVRLDSRSRQVWLGYGDGALAQVDLAAGKKLVDVKLTGHPESFQMETNGARSFVNVPDAGHVAVVDREQGRVVATWPLEKYHAHFPMALDEAGHRLFIGCRSPARLIALDTTSGKVVAETAIAGDTDDLFYDAGRRRIYLSGGEGFLDVIAWREADQFDRLARMPTRAGARTSYFAPDLNQIYLAVPQRGNEPAEVRIYEVKD